MRVTPGSSNNNSFLLSLIDELRQRLELLEGDYPEPPFIGSGAAEYEVRGEKRLYYVVSLRAYNADGELVDVGSESESDVLHDTYDLVRLQ